MSDFLWEVYYLALDILRDLAALFAGWALVLIVIGVPIMVLAYFAMKRGLARRGIHLNANWSSPTPQAPPQETKLPAAAVNTVLTALFRPARPPSSALMRSLDHTQSTLLGFYNGLVGGVGTILLAAAMYTAMVSTTANGLWLIAVLLFFAGASAFGHLWSHNRRYKDRVTLVPQNSGSLVEAIQPRISVLSAEPQVGVLDLQAIDRLKELSRRGASLEAICREVNPEYGQWDRFQQQAFQNVIQAALRHYSAAGPASAWSDTTPPAQ